MGKHRTRVKLVFILSILIVCVLSGSCTSDRVFNKNLSAITKPYDFNLMTWEFNAIVGEIRCAFCDQRQQTDEEASKVIEYFTKVERIKELKSVIEAVSAGDEQGDLASLEDELVSLQKQNVIVVDTVERIIKSQIREVLLQQGIFNPFYKHLKWRLGFPPLTFEVENPPYLLVVSPRDRIESIKQVMLQQNLSLEEIESIEVEVDELGVSSLVTEIGGFAAYPSVITSNNGLHFTIDTATEEWIHQYLAFKPLGFLYVLDLSGISRNYEIVTMNETLASMVSKEIGSLVCEKYYAQYENEDTQLEVEVSGFDFNREMRETRKKVDEYLAQGQIEPAEEFMEQQRQYLASNGYYIRKLNQAYFAFHGTYADSPTSISPIGAELKKLRSQSNSLEDFLETAAALTSRQQLKDSIK